MVKLIHIAGMAAVLLCSTIATAQNTAPVAQQLYVERSAQQNGKTVREIEPAVMLSKGDRVVVMLEWRAPRDGEAFTLETAIPRELAFLDANNPQLLVSADGGATWGRLGKMRLRDRDGQRRLVSPQDVTHLRWNFPASSPEKGRVMLSAVVR